MASVQALRRVGALRRLDPFPPLWRLLTSIRFALWLIGFLVVAGLLGILIPQMPPGIRDDPRGVDEWVGFQRGKFGPLTESIYRLGLFNVFGTLWFRAGLALLVVAIAVCVSNRFPPIWRTIRRPQKRVADSYLRRARHRAEFATPAEPEALTRVLRRHHYRVEQIEEGDAVYLFAERYQWAQLGTFASHLALIVLLAAGLVSMTTGYERQLFIAQGESAPVFPVQDPRQMQVYVEDAVGRFDESGRPLDYRSQLSIHQGGREVKRCVTTVNDPCEYQGYRFAQASYFGFGAELLVRDVAANRTVFDEVLELSAQMPAPRLVVRDDGGRVLLDQTVLLNTGLAGTYLARISVPETGRAYVVGARRDEANRRWLLVVFPSRDAAGAPSGRLLLAPEEEGSLDGLHFRFAGLSALPAAARQDIPLPPGGAEDAAGGGALLVQMRNAVYGSSQASSGVAVAAPAIDGPPTLTISGLGAEALALQPGESATVGGYQYTFAGQRPFAGIQVKRDRGAAFIWIGVGLLVAGLVITFHFPRRRVWAKIVKERTYMAGIAGPLVDLGSELRQMGAEAGATDALAHDETDD